MSKKNQLTVSGCYANIKVICDFVVEGANQSGLLQSEIFHIELACDEACCNIIEHAYGGDCKGDINVAWQATDTYFIVILKDNGRPFDPDNIPKPPKQPENLEDIKVGGLGLHFIHNLMDEVEFKFDNTGNVLIMKKMRQL